MATIDITCSLPAPTIAQVHAWLTRSGWYAVDAGPLGYDPRHERWSHTTHGRAWVPREELADWLVYVSAWIVNRAWQIESTPEAVYRDIVGPTHEAKRAEVAEARVAELEALMRKACALMDSHTSDDESEAQRCHEQELYALMDVDP